MQCIRIRCSYFIYIDSEVVVAKAGVLATHVRENVTIVCYMNKTLLDIVCSSYFLNL